MLISGGIRTRRLRNNPIRTTEPPEPPEQNFMVGPAVFVSHACLARSPCSSPNPGYRQGGSAGDDDMEAIALGPGGTVVLAGYTDGVWNETGVTYNDFVAVALDPAAFAPAAAASAAPPTPARDDGVSVLSSGPFVAGVCAVAAATALVALGVWVHRKRKEPRVRPESPGPIPGGMPVEDGGAGLGTFRALGEAASAMAHNCHVPGVSEAAALMEIVVKLVSDGRDGIAECESRLRQCRAIIVTLRRAEDLGEVELRGVVAARFRCRRFCTQALRNKKQSMLKVVGEYRRVLFGCGLFSFFAACESPRLTMIPLSSET